MSPSTGWGYAYGHNSLLHRLPLAKLSEWLRLLAMAVGLSLGLILFAQMLYPTNFSRPWLQVQGIDVGHQNAAIIGRRLAVFNQKSVHLQTASHTYQPKFSELGITVDQANSAKLALKYSLKERFIPFSLFRRQADVSLAKTFDEQRIKTWADRLAAENNKAADNATIQKNGQDYKITPAADGAKYNSQALLSQLKQIEISSQPNAYLPGEVLPASISTTMVETVIETARQQASRPLELTVANTPLTIAASDLQQMIVVATDPAQARVDIHYDRAALKNRLAATANDANIAVSSSATAVSLDEGVSQMITALVSGQKIKIELKPITVTTPITRQYLPTSGGVLALIMDWQKDNNLNTGVYFKELGSPYRSAGYRATEQFTTASTYKAFVGYYVYNLIDQGKLSFADSQGLDRPVRSCMVEMLVVSSNICSVAFGGHFGWGTIEAQSRQIGILNTHLESGNMLSTPADLGLLLEKLNNGTLLLPATTDEFLSALKRHHYRDGVPAGVPGIMVADKVGWISGVENDAAIVYHPRGTYILVVMTHGGTTRQIADLSRRINQFVSQ